MVRRGSHLSPQAARNLARPVSIQKIDDALKGIDVNKAPGLNGLNSFFFQKAWQIIKTHDYRGVMEFFDSRKLLKQVNNTMVILIPKIKNASHIKDLRPKACCSVITN